MDRAVGQSKIDEGVGRRMGRAASPIQKGKLEITIFHSSARSNYFVQLKYRFSPPSRRSPFDCVHALLPTPCLPPPTVLHPVLQRTPRWTEADADALEPWVERFEGINASFPLPRESGRM